VVVWATFQAAKRAEVDQEVQAVDTPIGLNKEHWLAESTQGRGWQDSQFRGASVSSNCVGWVDTHPLVRILVSLLGKSSTEGCGRDNKAVQTAAADGESG
jgi:3-deoxy-D-arabino-heptulosonate 7-phosphate (DAHP) synthase